MIFLALMAREVYTACHPTCATCQVGDNNHCLTCTDPNDINMDGDCQLCSEVIPS